MHFIKTQYQMAVNFDTVQSIGVKKAKNYVKEAEADMFVVVARTATGYINITRMMTYDEAVDYFEQLLDTLGRNY